MIVTEFVDMALDIAENCDTLYVMGCFGAPMNAKNKKRYCNNNIYNKKAVRTGLIQLATDRTFGFDCCGLVKGILWGFSKDKNKTYGGAIYKSNEVPDASADGLISRCTNTSFNFDTIIPGELVHMTGHCGIYVGNGRVVECSPKWRDGVQITGIAGYEHDCAHERIWTSHGRLPWVKYSVVVPEVTQDENALWDYFMEEIRNPYGVAALLGNLQAESALSSINLQNTANSKFNITDKEYTLEVDSGERNFIDGKGYGLAQWTSSGRKQNLLTFAKEHGTSIGELMMQAKFIIKELKSTYKSVYSVLTTSEDLLECSNAVLIKYEAPASKNKKSTQDARYKLAKKYFDKHVNKYLCPLCGQEVIEW